jgi:hypothetical protein
MKSSKEESYFTYYKGSGFFCHHVGKGYANTDYIYLPYSNNLSRTLVTRIIKKHFPLGAYWKKDFPRILKALKR